MDYKEMAARIAASRAASYWLKAAIVAAEKRDPCDALRDAETLLAFCRAMCAVDSQSWEAK
jgi:hypothetical protein